jgi:hypothetical protein
VVSPIWAAWWGITGRKKAKILLQSGRIKMAVHWKDAERQKNPTRPEGKPYRLFGLGNDGKPYFYWSQTKGQYAAYYGRNKPDRWVWGTLSCGSGKSMKPENRVFIADLAMAKALEKAGIFRPCGNCNKVEYRRWQQEEQSNV